MKMNLKYDVVSDSDVDGITFSVVMRYVVQEDERPSMTMSEGLQFRYDTILAYRILFAFFRLSTLNEVMKWVRRHL